ncbi:MAG: hypothetical protein JNK82_34420 [Myxococcaceae bacterium]|nr:hypothetical protein [Myxococcaceae bacterium]
MRLTLAFISTFTILAGCGLDADEQEPRTETAAQAICWKCRPGATGGGGGTAGGAAGEPTAGGREWVDPPCGGNTGILCP